MPRRKNRKARWRRLLFGVIAAIALFVLASLAVTLPLRWFDPPTTAFMLRDTSGRIPVAYDWVDWDAIGSAALLAVVAAEDQKFKAHFGLDIESIRDSIETSRKGGRLRGASTISQQVAKNLYLWSGRSFVRKGLEAWFTVLLETFLSKRRILEIYVNIAQFGPGIYGVGAASDHYFHKSPGRLHDREAALLAAVLPNPVRMDVASPSSYVRDRQAWILGQMARLRREGWLSNLR